MFAGKSFSERKESISKTVDSHSTRFSSSEEEKEEQNHYEEEMELERVAQVNSVIMIIDAAKEKLKISLLLPILVQNQKVVTAHLKGTKFERFLDLIDDYVKDKRLANKHPAPHLNIRLIRLIDFAHQHYDLINFLPDWSNCLHTEDRVALNAFEILHDVTLTHLTKSAIAELNKEKRAHQIYHENETLKRNIKEFEAKLRNQKINLRWKVAAKEGIIQKYEEDLAARKWESRLRTRVEITKSNKHLKSVQQASISKQRELNEELEKAKNDYEKAQRSNFLQEKEVCGEKNKLLLQLQALIKKYDQTLTEKTREEMMLDDEYEQEKKEFDEFMIIYDREEDEYTNFVTVKEEEERREQQEKLMLFMMNRAARIIQRFYRAWRREQKKKSKGGKKGKDKGKGGAKPAAKKK